MKLSPCEILTSKMIKIAIRGSLAEKHDLKNGEKKEKRKKKEPTTTTTCRTSLGLSQLTRHQTPKENPLINNNNNHKKKKKKFYY